MASGSASDVDQPFRAQVFKVSSLAGGGLSIILHVADEDSERAWPLSKKRGRSLMVAVEEIGE